MTDKKKPCKDGVNEETSKDFFKPYRIKPMEVYVEPGPGGCTREKTE